MAIGECNCGEVTFEILTKITEIYFCHCSICRRSTGGSGIPVVVVNNDDFCWLSGVNLIKTWTKPNHDWQTSFCQNCGSTLPGKNDEARMYIPAGTITEGDEALKVRHHIWTDSKAVWDEIGDQGLQHKAAFGSEN